jgi:hypothetical protein
VRQVGRASQALTPAADASPECGPRAPRTRRERGPRRLGRDRAHALGARWVCGGNGAGGRGVQGIRVGSKAQEPGGTLSNVSDSTARPSRRGSSSTSPRRPGLPRRRSPAQSAKQPGQQGPPGADPQRSMPPPPRLLRCNPPEQAFHGARTRSTTRLSTTDEPLARSGVTHQAIRVA